MRLKKIKLAGFKSFVEPTTVFFPSSLVAVVGPNGCGKSNIIDAARWVMGESSAKHLRGASMADVIFNGSSSRKALGQATVELIFDDNQDRLSGEYANYSEIAVKRLVNRDGQSSYFLNGSRCRRKDITDIFLGTGLGPRSYSIIGQGTIAKLIEARPEELRVFLEEAAGISKYKDRRRETENRIGHTRENLERLDDIRSELSKQLERLQRQAKAAERFKELRARERTLNAQLHALRFRDLNTQLTAKDKDIDQASLTQEALLTERVHIDSEMESHRLLHIEANDNFNHTQGEFYRIGAEIARLEEALQHQKERRLALEKELAEAQLDFDQASEHLTQDEKKIEECRQSVDVLSPQLEEFQQQQETMQDELSTLESMQSDWQQMWDGFNQQAAESSKRAHGEQMRIRYLEEKIESSHSKLETISKEQENQDSRALELEIEQFKEQIDILEQQIENCQITLNEQVESLKLKRQKMQSLEQQSRATVTQLQQCQGKLTSLEAMQSAALGKGNEALNDWLKKNQLDSYSRLAEYIDVEAGWETALESVLKDHLQSLCADDADDIWNRCLTDFEFGTLGCIEKESHRQQASSIPLVSLLDKVSCSWRSIDDLLLGIYLAEDQNEALSWRNQLGPSEIIVTRNGLIFAKTWFRLSSDEDEQAGVFQRAAQIKHASQELSTHQKAIEQLEEQQQELVERLEQETLEREQLSGQNNEWKASLADTKAKLRVKQGQMEQIHRRRAQLTDEAEEKKQDIEQAEQQLSQARELWQTAMQSVEMDAEKREELSANRESLNQRLDDSRQQFRDHQLRTHQSHVQLQTVQSQLTALQQQCVRVKAQLESSRVRKGSLEQGLQAMNTVPGEDMASQLALKLSQHLKFDEQMQQARQHKQSLELRTGELEKNRHQLEQKLSQQQSCLEKLRMDGQTLRVRCATEKEALHGSEFSIDDLLEALDESANESQWESEVSRVQGQIQRLGAINLAAIDEYKTESERKTYLDVQHQDLIQALETLEGAIAKIDKETKSRFKETFERVNNSFKHLFPKLFGGGQAFLELTGDDLLDTGVAVMARPPGKRNSSIHLLSGGEKAMTAVALVFAIFELNPSPFCMLDEVDAPLDDANVSRFCAMVKEMSKQVQFIFITHNKVTMELADHLSGVTMYEPGVSRIVSVDVDEAISIVEN